MDVHLVEQAEPDASPVQLARRIIEASRYMTLATADASGRPWASPVFFAPGRPGEFVWLSRPGAEHSRNLATRPAVSLSIFDSGQRPGTGQGVYVRASAHVVGDGELVDALGHFSRAAARWGAGAWTLADVSGEAELRLYRALAGDVWVMDSGNDPRGDHRTLVAL